MVSSRSAGPTNGIAVAITVMLKRWHSAAPAMSDTGLGDVLHIERGLGFSEKGRLQSVPGHVDAQVGLHVWPMSIWPQALS